MVLKIMVDDYPIVLHIPDHPFYIGLIDQVTVSDVPISLPFTLQVDSRYAVPRLQMTDEIRGALDLAYKMGSFCSTPLGESRLAAARMDEIINKILFLFDGDISGKTFLEIGCGNGELLYQLKLHGACVTGLEIGPQAELVEQRYHIPVVRSYLDGKTFGTPFDCIYSYGCLEHIDDLDVFFAACRACLKPGGLFLHSVPNAALSFDKVHLDHLLHEHINYFTPANGYALMGAQGFRSGSFVVSKAGNELMLWGYLDPNFEPRWPYERIHQEVAFLSTYTSQLFRKIEQNFQGLQRVLDTGKTLGFYAGGYEYGYRLCHSKIRYFDGDEYKHGKRWLAGLPEIEAPSALSNLLVDVLVVFKPHYFKAICDTLCELGVAPESILSIDSLSDLAVN